MPSAKSLAGTWVVAFHRDPPDVRLLPWPAPLLGDPSRSAADPYNLHSDLIRVSAKSPHALRLTSPRLADSSRRSRSPISAFAGGQALAAAHRVRCPMAVIRLYVTMGGRSGSRLDPGQAQPDHRPSVAARRRRASWRSLAPPRLTGLDVLPATVPCP